MKHIGLFEGIGGFSLAARWAGWETIAWCEWNEFGQKVLRHHFPEAEGFGDITKTDFTKYANRIDILTGGFPCQPYSQAGKRLGTEDDRHLWPEMLRVVREVQPTYVVGENVYGIVNWNGGLVFNEVQADLEAEGYEVWAYVLPAAAVNAPHRRDRVWFVAHRNSTRLQETRTEQQTAGFEQHGKLDRIITNPNSNGQQRCNSEHEVNTGERRFDAQCDFEQASMHSNGTSEQGQHFSKKGEREFNGPDSRNGIDNFQNFPTQSPICSGNDGLPTELDGITFSKWRNESIKAYGNAIVPQVAFEIFKAINQMAALADKEREAVFNNFQTELSNGTRM